MNKVMLTRAEVEQRVSGKFLGRNISFTDIRDKVHTGKVHQISVESATGELMVIFILGTDKTRHECDIYYFFENTTVHGNTSGTAAGTQRL